MSLKVLIVSDSHGRNANLVKAIDNMKGHLDLMIHLGDSQCSLEEIEALVDCPVEMVKGNSDSVLLNVPKEKVISIGPHRALLTHGHMYGGAWGIDAMKQTARDNGAGIVMFGHIHEPIVEPYSDVVVINPGSISQPRQEGHRPTYVVMTVEDDGRTDYVKIEM